MRNGSEKSGRPVTQRDVADYCGVSRATVSFALSGDPQIPPATRERIRAAAETLGYDPALYQAAKRLNQMKYGRRYINHAIAVILPPSSLHALYFSTLLEGIQDVFDEAGYALVVARYTPDAAFTLPPIFTGGEVDALIICGLPVPAGLIDTMRAARHFQQRPIISALHATPDASSVRADDAQGAYLATRHLLAYGHRYFLQTYPVDAQPLAHPRVAGIARALAESGLDPARHLLHHSWYLGHNAPPHHLAVPELDGPDQPELGIYRAVLRDFVDFVRAHPEITAIFAQNDPNARRVAYLLQQAGLRIPRDISLVGFDDTDGLVDDHGQNLLTTIRVPLAAVGQQAAQLAIRQVSARAYTSEHLLLPTTLVIRHTTGPASPR